MSWMDKHNLHNRERGDSKLPGWHAEPVNLMSNITFFLAAMVASQFAQSNLDMLLVYLAAAVGIFSALAHLQPTRVTCLLDEIVICVFVVAYFFIFIFNMIDIPIGYAVSITVAFFAIAWLCLVTFRHRFEGIVDFIPVLLCLWIGGIYVGVNDGVWQMIMSAILATLAVMTRAADRYIRIQVGTHFLWHIFAGWLMLNLILTKIISFPG